MIEINESNKYCTKDIAKWIRQTLKDKYKDLKFSVRIEKYSGGSSIYVYMLESKNIRFVKRFEEITDEEILSIMAGRNDSREEVLELIKNRLNDNKININNYHLERDWQITDIGKLILKKILKICNKYNWDNSDAMTDYFDVNYYLHLSLGKWNKKFIDGVETPKFLIMDYDGEDIWGRVILTDQYKRIWKLVNDKYYSVSKNGEPDCPLKKDILVFIRS